MKAMMTSMRTPENHMLALLTLLLQSKYKCLMQTNGINSNIEFTYMHRYDIRRLQCLEDFEEIEKLATWYEYFQKSYAEMEKEMIRRKNIDLEMQMKVEMMRQYLRIEIQEE